MEQTTLARIIADVRSQTDTETPTPTTDHITDAELVRWIRQAAAEMTDIILDHGGEEALDMLATSAVLTAPFTLPEDFYRVVSVDASVEGFDRQLARSSWRNRHRYQRVVPMAPRYRVQNGAISFFPSESAPSSATLWYVPAYFLASDADPAAELTTFNGWDEFLIACTAIKVCGKEGTDPAPFAVARQQAMARVITAATNLSMATTSTIIAATTYDEDLL
jgi:hypothetical protein